MFPERGIFVDKGFDNSFRVAPEQLLHIAMHISHNYLLCTSADSFRDSSPEYPLRVYAQSQLCCS